MSETKTTSEATPASATEAVLVLGMHRGGTSAMAGLLNLLGFELGPSLMPAAQGINNKGFWEHLDVFDIHERLLVALGRSRFDPREMPKGWLEHPAFHVAVDEVRRLIERDFSNVSRWAVKDPRMCRLVPVWLQALASLNIEPKIIIIARHPSEVARSMREQRWISSTARSHMCWLQHMLEAERFTRGRPRALITYDALLADWRSEMSRISAELSMDLDASISRHVDEIDAFLDPRERHQNEPDQTLPAGDGEMPSLTMELFDACRDQKNIWQRIADIDDIYRRGATSFAPCLDEAIVEASLARLEIGLGRTEENPKVQLDTLSFYGRQKEESYSPDALAVQQSDLRSGTAHLQFELPIVAPLDFLRIDFTVPGVFRIAQLRLGGTSVGDLADRAEGLGSSMISRLPAELGRGELHVVSPIIAGGLEIDLKDVVALDSTLPTRIPIALEVERLSGVAEMSAILASVIHAQQAISSREVTSRLDSRMDSASAELAVLCKRYEAQDELQVDTRKQIAALEAELHVLSARQSDQARSTSSALETIATKLDQLIASDAARFRIRKLFR